MYLKCYSQKLYFEPKFYKEKMDDILVRKIIIFASVLEKSFGNPVNYKLVYGNGLILDVEDLEQLRSSLWKRDHPEMEIYEAHSKSTQFTAPDYNVTVNETSFNHNVESWSLVLYLICFLVLIVFFLLISILEVCCKRTLINIPARQSQPVEAAPPPYDLFGPPTYDSLYSATYQKKAKQKRKCSVFVIHLPKRKSYATESRSAMENPTVQIQDEASPPPPP